MSITKGKARKIKEKVAAKKPPTEAAVKLHIKRIQESLSKLREIQRLEKDRKELALALKSFTVQHGRSHNEIGRAHV